jgi:MFS family permease
MLLPAGIQSVLFPYLIAVVLNEPADRLGIAQMTGALPGLFLILFGGVAGDRFDQRRILIVLHLFGMLPPLVLAVLLSTGSLDYGLMLGYALIWGVVGAFSQPARDALLSRVAADRIQRTVTMMMALQFAVQIVGIDLGGLADRVGAVPLVLTQAIIMGLGAFAVLRIRVERFIAPADKQHALHEVAAALRLVWGSRRMLPVMVLAFAIGLFFAGTYVVLIPLTVRDVYQGGASGIAHAFMLNMIGTVAATLLLLVRGGVARPGRAVVLALAIGSAVLLPLYWGVSIEVFYLIIFAWGAGAGVVMSMSRTIVQEAAPPAFRARVMSVYSLGMMGGMPIGSLATGYIVSAVGPLNAALVPVVGMAIVVAAVAARSDLWRLLPDNAPARV